MKDNDIDIDLEEYDADFIENDYEGDANTLNYNDNKDIVYEKIPSFGSVEWHYYVMSQFESDELYDINNNLCPTCDGLRRVVEQLIGPIVSVDVVSNSPPTSKNGGIATVCVGVSVLVREENHPLVGNQIRIEDVVDVGGYNTEHPFNKHQSATAMTKAEGRIYRKMLRLRNIQTAEEMDESKITQNPEDAILETQINVIDTLCKRLDIDVMQFVNMGDNDYKYISKVPNSNAAKMIQYLNKIQQGKEEKPEEISNYKEGWNE